MREKLSRYNFTVKWTPGKSNIIAVALSRAPIFDPEGKELTTSSTIQCLKNFDEMRLLTSHKYEKYDFIRAFIQKLQQTNRKWHYNPVQKNTGPAQYQPKLSDHIRLLQNSDTWRTQKNFSYRSYTGSTKKKNGEINAPQKCTTGPDCHQTLVTWLALLLPHLFTAHFEPRVAAPFAGEEIFGLRILAPHACLACL